MASEQSLKLRACMFAAVLFLSPYASLATTAKVSSHQKSRRGPPSTGVSEKSSNRIQAVTDTLKDIFASIQNEETTETKNYEKYTQWCQTRVQKINTGLTDSEDSLGTGKVSDAELTASIETITNTLDQIKTEITAIKDGMAQSDSIRSEENDKYNDDIQMNAQSLKQIANAVSIVGKVHGQGGFLQNGVVKRVQVNEPGESNYVLGIMKGLSTRLEKTRDVLQKAENQQVEQYDAYMTTKKTQFASLQTQKSEKTIKLQEDRVGIVSVKNDIEQLTEEIQTLTTSLRQTVAGCDEKMRLWKLRVEDRAKEKAALSQAINYIEEMSSKISQGTGQGVQIGQGVQLAAKGADQCDSGTESEAESECLASVQRLLPDGTTQGRDNLVKGSWGHVPTGCSTQSGGDWAAHYNTGNGKNDGSYTLVCKAQGSAASLLQTGESDSESEGASGGELALAGAADAQLAALGATVGTERRKAMLDGAKKVVQKLMDYLQQQQKDEAEKRDYCKDELAKKEDDKASTLDEIDALAAKIGTKSSTVATLQSEVEAIDELLKNMKQSLTEAETLRKNENSIYKGATKDRTLAVKVLKQAKMILHNFYKSKEPNALLQQPEAPPDTWSGSGRKSVSSLNVLELVDKVAEDIVAEQKDADMGENEAQSAYERLARDSQDEFDRAMGEVTERVKQKATLNVQINNHKESKQAGIEKRDSIEAQLKSLHDECDQLIQNFEKRTKARDFETSQLRDVLDILAGSDISSRTGLVQQSAGTEGDQDKTLMQDMSQAIGSIAANSA